MTLAVGVQALWRGYYARQRFYTNLERLLETGADTSVVCSMALLQGGGPVMVAGAEMLDVTSLDIGRRS